MAEGRGFEPPVGLPLRLISSQVPLTTQPPFRSIVLKPICANRPTQQADFLGPWFARQAENSLMRLSKMNRFPVNPPGTIQILPGLNPKLIVAILNP